MTASTTDNGILLLFQQIAEGDELAFGRLYNQYAPKIKSFLARYTHSQGTAEDITQNIFIRVWIARDQLVHVNTPVAWLYKAATNQAINHLRKQASEAKAIDKTSPGTITNPDEQVQFREMKEAIHEAIQALPARRRQIYQLQRDQGMKQQQIADELGISLATVRNTMSEAMDNIRTFLTERGLLVLALMFMMRD